MSTKLAGGKFANSPFFRTFATIHGESYADIARCSYVTF